MPFLGIFAHNFQSGNGKWFDEKRGEDECSLECNDGWACVPEFDDISCTKRWKCIDFCEGINCGSGGDCLNGICNCQTGYANVENFCQETCELRPCKELIKIIILFFHFKRT